MGSSQSITKIVNKTVMDSTLNQTCTCKAEASNKIGNITINEGACCPATDVKIAQNAKAKCSCPMNAAINTIAKQSTNASQKVMSSLSLASSTSKSSMDNETFVRTTLNQMCGSEAAATNSIGNFTKNQPSCCGMTSEQLQSFGQSNVNISQTASAQASCLMGLAQKIESDITTKSKDTTTSKDPLNMALSNIGNIMGNFGNAGKYLIIGVLVLIGFIVVMVVAGRKRPQHHVVEHRHLVHQEDHAGSMEKPQQHIVEHRHLVHQEDHGGSMEKPQPQQHIVEHRHLVHHDDDDGGEAEGGLGDDDGDNAPYRGLRNEIDSIVHTLLYEFKQKRPG